MVIDDLNILGITVLPQEADAPLVVDPNTTLAASVAGKLLQTITVRDTEKVEGGSAVSCFSFRCATRCMSWGSLAVKAAVE